MPNLFTRFKNAIRGGVRRLSGGLTNIEDDPRIAMPDTETSRIKRSKRYYEDDFKQVTHKNSYGDTITHEMNSLNVVKMAARKMASLIFNERCSINVTDMGNENDTSTQDLLDSIFQDNNFYLTYENELERAIALGTQVPYPYVENDKIKIAFAEADQCFPLQSNVNDIDEIAIASRTTTTEHHQNVYYTLLEFHQWQNGDYVITNELYRSMNVNQVGVQVPLDTLDKYKGLQSRITINREDGSPLEKPLFAFYKNPGSNNKCMTSPFGLGIADNALNTVDAINRTHDEFIWELKTGQRRIVVPMSWLSSPTQGRFGWKNNEAHPRVFDADETVYQGMYQEPDNQQFKDVTSDIRVQEFADAMQYFLHEFENEIGVSQGTFTVTPTGVQTATEVVTNNSMTYQTRSSYLTQVEKTIDQLVYAILEVASCPQFFSDNQARWSGDIDNLQISVDFNDGVFVDKQQQKQTDLQFAQAGIIPKKQVLIRDYGLDEQTAEEWLAEVEDEQSSAAPQLTDQELELFSGVGNGRSSSSEDDSQEKDSDVDK